MPFSGISSSERSFPRTVRIRNSVALQRFLSEFLQATPARLLSQMPRFPEPEVAVLSVSLPN